MSSEFKFIHTADIHLGSILNFSEDSQVNINDLCKNAVYDAFNKICIKAVEHEVDFILISGDLYDLESPSVRAYSFFMEQCKKLYENNIKLYIIAGNHDCLSSQKELFKLPENVHVLSAEKVEAFDFVKNGKVMAKIIGQSYMNKSLGSRILSEYEVENDNVFNIGMLHTSLESSNNNYVPCSLRQLGDKENFHYWALGHVHKKKILREYIPAAAFPGIPQGRDMGEQGVGACLLVNVIDKEIENIKVIPISSIVYKQIELYIEDIEGREIENLSDLENTIVEKSYDLIEESLRLYEGESFSSFDIKGYVVRWIIRGKGAIHNIVKNINEEDSRILVKNINNCLGNKKPFIWTDSIRFKTKEKNPELEELFYKNNTFKELQNIFNNLHIDENFKRKILNSWGNIWFNNGKKEEQDFERFQVDDEIYKDIVERACDLVTELLMENN